MSEVKHSLTFIDSIKETCKIGLYADALSKAENQWGPIHTWKSHEQVDIAIMLYINLGGDRRSDAILLHHWRNNKTCLNLLSRVFYYKLNKFGPILANQFVKENEEYFFEDKEKKAELVCFKSIIQRLFKNYSKADSLLNEAVSLDPNNNRFISLKIQLLHEQNESFEAKLQAQKQFDTFPSPANLRLLSTILRKTDGAEASLELYKQYAKQFQSASVWFTYASLLAGVHDWEGCENALSHFEKIRIVEDKEDNKALIEWKAQIAIYKQDIGLAIKLLSQSASGYWDIIRSNLEQSSGELTRKVLDVPFLKQEHMTCAPTTIAALCKFWGHEYNSQDIADEICFDGTPDTKERQWLRDHNYSFKEFELKTELAYELIDQNIPFALVTSDGFSSHIQAVIGYNQQVGTLYIMDPSNPVMQEMLTRETIESEAYNGARCIVFVPQDKRELLSQFDFPASELYPIWDSYSLAAERNDYAGAKKALDELISIAPHHRITLRVKRDIALWNNDSVSILECTNQLLERFPDQTILLNSKFLCYRDLGRRNEGIKLLSDYLTQNINLDLIGTLFNEIYDTTDDTAIKAKAVEQIKRYGGYSANCHWSLANHYWAQYSYELALEHYLYAYCLDDTNSKYVESYFMASRHLDRVKEALDFLRVRFHKYKVRSHLPAISLYEAYELLGKEHLGIEYLFEALELHPSETPLLIYLSKKLIDKGLIEQFERIKEQLVSNLEQNDFKELIARKNEKIGNFEEALEYFQSSFRQKPFANNYANSYFRLLRKRGNIAELDTILENLLKEHRDNTLILDYIADWHSDPIFREKVLTDFVSMRPDYGVIRRQLIDVRIEIGNVYQALEMAKDTCEVIIGEHINTSYLANCYLKVGDFIQAKSIAREVLSKSIDNDLAYTVLMSASRSKDEKQLSLKFVFSEIKKQTIFGDSAWNFWFDAKSCLSKNELENFIDYLLKNYQHLWYTYSLVASFYVQYDDLDEAFSHLKSGIDRFPLTPRLYNDLGQLYELNGNIPATIQAYQQALTINPAWDDVTKRLSDIFEKHGSLDSAIETVKRGIKHSPDNGVLFGYLADLHIKQNNQNEAIEALQYAVRNSTDYRWAWNQLINLCDNTERHHFPRQLASELSKQAPYQAHVWRDLAYVTDGGQDKLLLLDRSIECDRFYIHAYYDKAQYYVNKGDYKEALVILDETPWGSSLPNQLAIQKIDLLIDVGQKQLAIDKLKTILFYSQGNAHLWSKLFNLLEEEGEKEAYLDSCYKSVEQNKHDPDVLCYAAENLIKHGSKKDKEVAKNYLKKAFNLSPNDQYIVLTYVDLLVDDQDYQGALESLNSYEKFGNSCHAHARKINVLCKLQRYEEALEIYKQLILGDEADYWCLEKGFQALRERYSFKELTNLYSQFFDSLTRIQAYFYTDIALSQLNKNYKPVLWHIDQYPDGEQWSGAFLALLEFWNDKKIAPPEKVVEQYFDRIVNVPALIEQLGAAYIEAGRYKSMVKLFESSEVHDELPAFVYYHYRLALQMLNRWDDASAFIIKGLQQKPDNAIHNLKLWYAYDLVRTGQELTSEDIEIIDFSELVEIEQYVYCTLVVSLELGENSLESKLDDLTPLLRRCQQAYQTAVGQNLAEHAKRALRAKLKNAIETKGFWALLKLTWWISNRF